MKNRLLITLLGFTLFACTPSSKITITNLQDLASYQENSMIYALPRTKFAVHVQVVQHEIVPGPFRAYAEKYLGIKDVPQNSQAEYELIGVEVKALIEADPDYYYALTSSNPSVAIPDIFQFCDQGLILDGQRFIPFSAYTNLPDQSSESAQYLDLSVKRFIESNTKKKDTDGENIPLELKRKAEGGKVKSLEQKAREASDFIFKIRKRRFKLLAGQYDVFPEGEALATSIQELNDLEAKYLALFVGKRFSDTLQKRFTYVPQSFQELERSVICRFSAESGISDAGASSGSPLVLELKSKSYTNAIKQVQLPQVGPSYENLIFYRIPELTTVRLFLGSRVIIELEETVYQYGPLVPVSTSLLDTNK